MSEHDDHQERTEDATSKRKEESREKGQVASSKDLNTAVLLTFSAASLIIFGDKMGAGYMKLCEKIFSAPREILFNVDYLMSTSFLFFKDVITLIFPLFLVCFMASFIGPVSMVGFHFSLEALTPNLGNINPISGIKKMFSLRSLVELLKALIKFLVIAFFSFLFLKHSYLSILSLSEEPINLAVGHGLSILLWCFLAVSSATILLALFDVPYQWWEHSRTLKMTKQEIKEETKQSEGRPETKANIRKMQTQLARSRMMQKVPEADVVITNPTHYAVALKYDRSKQQAAPILIAKGVDFIAEQIIKIANGKNIPLVQAPPLARAIYHSTKVDTEIPGGLYTAVARVLAYVYHLRRYHAGKVKKPLLGDLPIPEELKR